MKKNRSAYDLAHGCFLLCGLTALAIGAMSAIPLDPGIAGGVGFLVAIPLSLASLAAMVVGIVLTVRLWKQWTLVFLSGASVLLTVELLIEYGSTTFYNAVPIVYGAGVVAICGAWFLVSRRRCFPKL